MAENKALEWHKVGERRYETGVDRGVLFNMGTDGSYKAGVAWDGLSQVTESPSGAEPTALYADNMKYLELMSAEEFGYTIEAYSYPPEFEPCDGSKEIAPGVVVTQQDREHFGFSYRTKIGNDTKGVSFGYKIHLVYNSLATPSEKNRSSVNDSPEAVTFSWTASTTPVEVAVGEDMKPTAHLIIDSTKVNAKQLAAIEKMLYGSTEAASKLPSPAELVQIINDNAAGDTV